MALESRPERERRAIEEVEQLMLRARAEVEAGRDAALYLWLARRALREFGRRRAKKVCGK
jgi:hypothetical protein